MWMMTKIGFFSIVEKPKGKICIRARCREDLENLIEEVIGRPFDPIDIQTTLRNDYPYRLFISRDEFMQVFDEFLKLVTYSNFKNEVGKTNPKREKLYHQVWALLRQIEKEEKNGKRTP